MNHIHDKGNMRIATSGQGVLRGPLEESDGPFVNGGTSDIRYDGGTYPFTFLKFDTNNGGWSGYTGGILNADWNNPYGITNTQNSGGTEARSINSTYRIWLRTA